MCNGCGTRLLYPEGICNGCEGLRQKQSSLGKIKVLGTKYPQSTVRGEREASQEKLLGFCQKLTDVNEEPSRKAGLFEHKYSKYKLEQKF